MRVRLASGPADLGRCLALRREVFCREQGIPEALEIDAYDKDPATVVLMAEEDRHELVGCLRLRLAAPSVVKLERAAVRRDARGRGIGRALAERFDREALDRFPEALGFLHAQKGSVGFYWRLGWFALGGKSFDEAGIPHLAMARIVSRLGQAVHVERVVCGEAPEAARALVLGALYERGVASQMYVRDLDDLAASYGEGAFLVMCCGDRVVGAGGWVPDGEPSDRRVEIRRLFLAPDIRGHGLGAKLLVALELDAAYAGFRRAVLEPGAADGVAGALYRTRGYDEACETGEGARPTVRLAKALPRMPVGS